MTTWLATGPSGSRDRGQQAAELVAEEGQRRLVAHRVLGEGRLLELRVDGVAVERRRERRAVLEIRAGGGAAFGRATDVSRVGGSQMNSALGLFAGGARH